VTARVAIQERRFLVSLARAAGGAILFALPLYMTAEMWALGFTIDRVRLVLFIGLFFPLLVVLSRLYGFEETTGLRDDLVDAFVAFGVSVVVGTAALGLLGVVRGGLDASDLLGKVALQAVPGALGAVLAMAQLQGDERPRADREEVSYGAHLAVLAAGALFLGLNIAPTDEVMAIVRRTSPWHAVAIATLSLAIVHAFVYALEFRGQVEIPTGHHPLSVFLRYSVVGYGLALATSAFILWALGRLDDLGFTVALRAIIVLGLPAALGAAAARLIL
jgi:putative integral membrane protein (TIGR02587 family)